MPKLSIYDTPIPATNYTLAFYVTMKSFWYTKTVLVERLRIILTPHQVPTSQLQRRRVEYTILLFFESILGGSNNSARVFLGIGFDITFGVSLSDSLQELDKLD